MFRLGRQKVAAVSRRASGGWLTLHVKPDACETCNGELVFWEDKVPMSEDELLARCKGFAEGGCPKCGERNVLANAVHWD